MRLILITFNLPMNRLNLFTNEPLNVTKKGLVEAKNLFNSYILCGCIWRLLKLVAVFFVKQNRCKRRLHIICILIEFLFIVSPISKSQSTNCIVIIICAFGTINRFNNNSNGLYFMVSIMCSCVLIREIVSQKNLLYANCIIIAQSSKTHIYIHRKS